MITSPGKVAYEAFANASPTPAVFAPWHELKSSVRFAWDAAADAARAHDAIPDTVPRPVDVEAAFCGAV